MVNSVIFITVSTFYLLMTTFIIQLDNKVSNSNNIKKVSFQYAAIATILKPFFYSGITLIFHTLIVWFGIYTGYLINNFFISREKKG